MFRWTLIAAALLLAAPAAAGAPRFPHGRYACIGPGDWAEHGDLFLLRGGRYVYRHTMPAMDHTVSRGRYRVAGERIRFASGEYRSRDFVGVWRRPNRSDPAGWIHFRFGHTGADTGFNCTKL